MRSGQLLKPNPAMFVLLANAALVEAVDVDPTSGRRFQGAYVGDCAAFGVAMVNLPPDLRIPPDAIQSWVCVQPEGEGLRFMTMEGMEPAQG